MSVSSGPIDGPDDAVHLPMTDLSILCLHNSTTSWESQQRGGIVVDVMVVVRWVVVVVEVAGAVDGGVRE
jgi:hypothetical protein